MSEIYRNLLAIDDLAQRHGCGLHPALRTAIEAELRFESKSSGPLAVLSENAELPDHVTRLTFGPGKRRGATG